MAFRRNGLLAIHTVLRLCVASKQLLTQNYNRHWLAQTDPKMWYLTRTRNRNFGDEHEYRIKEISRLDDRGWTYWLSEDPQHQQIEEFPKCNFKLEAHERPAKNTYLFKGVVPTECSTKVDWQANLQLEILSSGVVAIIGWDWVFLSFCEVIFLPQLFFWLRFFRIF